MRATIPLISTSLALITMIIFGEAFKLIKLRIKGSIIRGFPTGILYTYLVFPIGDVHLAYHSLSELPWHETCNFHVR
jgi:hypothetical protein